MSYVLISLAVLFVSYYLFRSAAGSLSIFHPNPISYIFYYQIILQTFIASVLIITRIDNHYIINTINLEDRYKGWFFVQYAMLALPIGMLIAKFVLSPHKSMRSNLFSYARRGTLLSSRYEFSTKFSILILTIISAIACIYTFIKIGYLPVYRIISIDVNDILIQRAESSREFTGAVYIKNILAVGMMPILSYTWISYYIPTRNRYYLVMSIVTFIFSINILLYDLSKSPVILYILGLIFVFYYNSIKIKLLHILVFLSLSLSLLIFQYIIAGYNINDILSYNSGPIGRLILTQAAGFYYVLTIFPDKMEHLGFSSISNVVSWIFEMDYMPRSARVAMEFFHPAAVQAGEAGVMNSIFLEEAWANFGTAGLIISPLWVGFFVQSLYIFFLRMPKSPIFLSTFAKISIFIPITGGFNDFIYPLWIAFPILTIFFVYITSYFIYICIKNRYYLHKNQTDP